MFISVALMPQILALNNYIPIRLMELWNGAPVSGFLHIHTSVFYESCKTFRLFLPPSIYSVYFVAVHFSYIIFSFIKKNQRKYSNHSLPF